jgi:hypothetical protein
VRPHALDGRETRLEIVRLRIERIDLFRSVATSAAPTGDRHAISGTIANTSIDPAMRIIWVGIL